MESSDGLPANGGCDRPDVPYGASGNVITNDHPLIGHPLIGHPLIGHPLIGLPLIAIVKHPPGSAIIILFEPGINNDI